MKPILSGGLVLRTLALAAVFIALVAAWSHVVNGAACVLLHGMQIKNPLELLIKQQGRLSLAQSRIASTLTTSGSTR